MRNQNSAAITSGCCCHHSNVYIYIFVSIMLLPEGRAGEVWELFVLVV